MKNKFLKTLSVLLIIFVASCTDDFNEINERPDALSAQDVSAKFFVTDTQQKLFAPNRTPFWRGTILQSDRFSGHFAHGYAQSFISGENGWSFNFWFQEFVYNWLADYNSTLTAFTNFVKEGGSLENDQYYAISLIMKGLYYQLYVDTHGMVPYSEASDPDITLPKYDELKDIYTGVISELDQAISLIGNNTSTGSGVEKLGDNDLFFSGDMQKWKQLANSLKLRMALRAQGAPGESFSAASVSQAISSGVLTDTDALINRDINISQWASATYGDVWHNFYGIAHWHVGSVLLNTLQDNNDPRLSKYAVPAKGGTVTIVKPTEGGNVALIDKHVAFLKSTLDRAGAEYTMTESSTEININMPENTNYIGLPTRLSDKPKAYMDTNLFSEPSEIVRNQKNSGNPIFPWVVMSAGESNLLVAEAIVKGLASGNANQYYQKGIEHAMALWDVSSADIAAYLSTEMGSLSGSTDQQLEKIATQRWIANYTNGYEAWSIVRDTGYPSSVNVSVSDTDLYGLGGELNGAYPGRLQYGSSVYGNNVDNTNAALAKMGPDNMATKLWWAK